MTAIDEPVTWDRTVYRGTDHKWKIRRVDTNNDPIIPTEAEAQIRNRAGGDLWAQLDVTIDDTDGWITITLPEADTQATEWDGRTHGAWDLEVEHAGRRLRWIMGRITISDEVTRDE